VLYVIDNIIKASFPMNEGFRTTLNVFTEIAKVCFVIVLIGISDYLVDIGN